MFIQVHLVTCSSNITNQNVIDLMIRPELKSTHKFFTVVAMKQFNIALHILRSAILPGSQLMGLKVSMAIKL